MQQHPLLAYKKDGSNESYAMVTFLSQTQAVVPIQISRNSAKISPKAILWCCDYSFMFLFPLWLWSSLAPGSWKRICSTSSVGTTFGGKARLWLPFFILLYWKACASTKSLDICPNQFFFPARPFKILHLTKPK